MKKPTPLSLKKATTHAMYLVLSFILISGISTAIASVGDFPKNLDTAKTTGSTLTFDEWNDLADMANVHTSNIKIEADGNIGLGLNPSETAQNKLTVKYDSATQKGAYIWNETENPEIALGTGNNHWGIYSTRDGVNTKDLRFWNESNKMVITKDGTIGINTDTPDLTTKLDVNGNTRIQGDTEINGKLNLADSAGLNSDTVDGKHAATQGANIVPVTDASGVLADSVIPASAAATGGSNIFTYVGTTATCPTGSTILYGGNYTCLFYQGYQNSGLASLVSLGDCFCSQTGGGGFQFLSDGKAYPYSKNSDAARIFGLTQINKGTLSFIGSTPNIDYNTRTELRCAVCKAD